MKRPAFQFYPGDWQRDAALRSCSISARGLWMEMLCIMHQAEPYGHLVVNGRPIDAPTLARMVGGKAGEVKRGLGELERAGVFDMDGGTMVSRRMVRDERLRKARAEGGKLGGNPALMDNRKVDEKVNHPPNLQPTPSSSTSSSTSEKSKALSGKPDPAPLNGKKAEAVKILEFLNAKAGHRYKPVDSNIRMIVARLTEGFSADDIRSVVVRKCDQWKGDEKMAEYLRPKTLFAASNFANYEGQLGKVE